MPLEAINDIILQSLAGQDNTFVSTGPAGSYLTAVTADFFQGSSIDGNSVKPDFLGFLSLVLGIAKRAQHMESDESVKMYTPIMPRTDFVTMFAQVSSQIPEGQSLYDLIKMLACYKNAGSGVA